MEGGALVNGIGAFIKRCQRVPLPFLPCEDTGRRQWSMGQGAGPH